MTTEINNIKYNYCGECDCSCECDGSCKGNPKNCTSKKALKKGCTHHCGCYLKLFSFEDYKEHLVERAKKAKNN